MPRIIGGQVFPEISGDAEYARGWKSDVRVHTFATKVLAVAETRIEGTWKAYVDAVPGMNHKQEWREVLRTGAMLDPNVAKELFPGFREIPYAR